MTIFNNARVATVILNFDDADDTMGLIDSIRMSDDLNQRLIVVDNDPTASQSSLLGTRLGPGITYLPAGANVGYAAGNNIGISAALEGSPEFVWILNPDVRVAPSTLSGLLAAANTASDAAIIGGRILHGGSNPQSIWFDGGIIDASRQGATSHTNSGKHHASTASAGIVDVDYVTGACMLLRVGAIEQVGLIPEEYFLYFEETAYCKQMQQYGWRTVVDQSVVLSHFKRSSGSLPTAHYLYYMTRNRLHFADTFFASESGLAVALDDFTRTFIEPWKKRVAERAPHWLPTFETVITTALADAHAGKQGKADSIPSFPSKD